MFNSMLFPHRQSRQTRCRIKLSAILWGKMKKRHITIIVILSAALLCGRLWAGPTTSYEAEQVVTGWLNVDSQPLGIMLGRSVSKVETFFNDQGDAVYYIVYLEPSGFAIVSADDSIEPIVGFADDGTFDPSTENPLWTLVHNDLNSRFEVTQNTTDPSATLENSPQAALRQKSNKARDKWTHFINLADTKGGPRLMGQSCISDIRVAPFIQSKWGQTFICSDNCFNYYIPNHYPCGCMATVIAQLMRYYEYPTDGIGELEFTVMVDGIEETYTTLGGDGAGGPYNWNLMPLQPQLHCNTITDAQRQAIGALCYDAGLAMNMEYYPEGSGAIMPDTMFALLDTFMYSNVVLGYNSGNDIGDGLIKMINPNLDAKAPVVLGIMEDENSYTGHAVLCDGYGYNYSTLYHHLNMGWQGIDDAWYNLPVINVDKEFNAITSCLYNIYTSGSGEIISGRVFDSEDNPVPNAVVFARSGTQSTYESLTDYKGIYAIKGLNSDTTYRVWVEKEGYIYSRRSVATGKSQDFSETSGNCRGIDFYPQIVLNPPTLSTYFVDDNAPGDPGPGDTAVSNPLEDGSSDHPFDTIQEAIDMAEPSETVIVLPGTYTGQGNRDLDFKGKSITVKSTEPNDFAVVTQTVIDCNASQTDPHSGFIFQNYETPQSIIAGLTITGGYNECGGGIFLGQCASPALINCILSENEASFGGGIYMDNAGPTIINCQFKNNLANAGGAVYSFSEGAGCNPVLDNCLFKDNSATHNGGAIYNNGQANSTFTNSEFVENTSSGGGGAIRNTDLANPTLTNCIFSKNQAQTFGGGIRNSNNCNVTLTNCTFSSNSAANGSSLACTADDENGYSPSNVQVINCIITDTRNHIFNIDSSTINISYSNVPNSNYTDPWPGQGNIYTDPFFADADNGDFHLKSQTGRYEPNSQSWIVDDITSPCIDAGDMSNPVDPEPLPNGDRVNMGAYGGTAEASKSFLNQAM